MNGATERGDGMSEPVRLYRADGTQFDCVAPSEVRRLLESGEWSRTPQIAPTAPKTGVHGVAQQKPYVDTSQPAETQNAVGPQNGAGDEIPFATPLPKRKPGRPRKGDWGAL